MKTRETREVLSQQGNKGFAHFHRRSFGEARKVPTGRGAETIMLDVTAVTSNIIVFRSEERRVGKECRL